MMVLNFENGQIVIKGEIEDFRHLIDSKLIPENLLESGGSFMIEKPVVFKVFTDVEKLLGNIIGDDLVSQFRKLFPEGTSKEHGKTFKGNLKKCIDNLKRFKKEFKYSDELILDATKRMIERQVKIGKKEWIPQAHYFIYHKDRGSELATECENVINGTNSEPYSKWK